MRSVWNTQQRSSRMSLLIHRFRMPLYSSAPLNTPSGKDNPAGQIPQGSQSLYFRKMWAAERSPLNQHHKAMPLLGKCLGEGFIGELWGWVGAMFEWRSAPWVSVAPGVHSCGAQLHQQRHGTLCVGLQPASAGAAGCGAKGPGHGIWRWGCEPQLQDKVLHFSELLFS